MTSHRGGSGQTFCKIGLFVSLTCLYRYNMIYVRYESRRLTSQKKVILVNITQNLFTLLNQTDVVV